MQQPVAPSVRRNFKSEPLNHHTKDTTTESGVRVSVPIYIDLTTTQRKSLLNDIREKCADQAEVTSNASVSGIRTVAYSSAQPEIESFIGMSMEVLRTFLFQRGGLDVALLLRLQSVAGKDYVTVKEIETAVKAKQALVKKYVEEYAYGQTE